MENPWAVTRFSAFANLTDDGLAELKTLVGPARELKRGEILRREGEPHPKMYLLCSGWTASTVKVGGEARLMLKVHMPGDLLGLPSLPMLHAVDTLCALTRAVVLTVESCALGRLFEVAPRLGALLFLISQEERVMLIDRLASLGRSDAAGRLAVLLIQLHLRALRHDPCNQNTFVAPLTQNDIADLTGLTTVHVNRTLQRLRAVKVIRLASKSVTILDRAELIRISGLPPRVLATDLSWLPPP